MEHLSVDKHRYHIFQENFFVKILRQSLDSSFQLHFEFQNRTVHISLDIKSGNSYGLVSRLQASNDLYVRFGTFQSLELILANRHLPIKSIKQSYVAEDLSYCLICLSFTCSRRYANFNDRVGDGDDSFSLLTSPRFDVTL